VYRTNNNEKVHYIALFFLGHEVYISLNSRGFIRSPVTEKLQISTILAISPLKDAIHKLQGVRTAEASSVAF
jgi:hypothetical protein